jgi:uncharacterized cupredoxin-like copper-binding protein
MRRKSTLTWAAVVPLAAFAIAGCGGGGSSNSSSTPASTASTGATGAAAAGAAAAGGAQAIKFSETEYALSNPGAVKTGKVTVAVTNNGKVDHALQVDGPGVENQGISSSSPIKPGKTAKFTIDLKQAGKYKFYCPIDGHKSLGMVRYINVQ